MSPECITTVNDNIENSLIDNAHNYIDKFSNDFSLKRRLQNAKRLAEFGPTKEILLNLPEDGPSGYFKRFSSDGRFLFAFGGDGRFLIHPVKYGGCLYQNDNNEKVTFDDFFRREPIEIDVISGLRNVVGCPEMASTLLCRDFCLTVPDDNITSDSYVILAGSCPADCYEIEDKPPQTFLITSESVRIVLNDSHTALPCLDHVTFYLVNLKKMKVVDYIHFKYDFIYLSHHLGVDLKENVFTILSMKNQRIFKFEIDFESDRFIQKFDEEICRNSTESNTTKTKMFISKIPEIAQRDDSWGREGFGGIILKLIKYLSSKNLSTMPLPYSILESLHIWKHENLTGNSVLLRLSPANLILASKPRHQSMVHALDPLPSIHKNSYLILYNRQSGEIESVCNGAESGLLEWIKRNWRWLRGRSGDADGFESILLSISRGNMNNSIIRRITNILPRSPQQSINSPWLDPEIIRWDPKITAILSRSAPINCNHFMNSDGIQGATGLYESNYGPAPVKFFSRAHSNLISHILRFIDSNTESGTNPANDMDRHKWINVIFHPTLPLIIVYQYGIFRALNMRIFYNQ